MSYRIVGCSKVKVNNIEHILCSIGYSANVYIKDGIDTTLYVCIMRRFGNLFSNKCYHPSIGNRSDLDVWANMGTSVGIFDKLNIVASYQSVSANLRYSTNISSSGTCFNVYDNEAIFVTGLNRFYFRYSGSSEYFLNIQVHSDFKISYLGIFKTNNYTNLCIYPIGSFDVARAYTVSVSGYSIQDAWVYVTNCEECYALPGGFVKVPWADIDATSVNLEF